MITLPTINRKILMNWIEWKDCFTLIFLLRLLVFICLFGTVIIGGFFSYNILKSKEEKKFLDSYFGAVSHIHDAINNRLKNVYLVNDELAQLAGVMYPHAHMWPFAHVLKYNKLCSNLRKMSFAVNAFTAPVVFPSQVEEFVSYAQEMYRIHPEYPENTGSLGITSYDPASSNTGMDYPSNYTFLLPILNVMQYIPVMSLADYRNMQKKTPLVDESYRCGLETAGKCIGLSQILVKNGDPRTVMHQVIYPYHDPTALVGFQGVVISWKDMLFNLTDEIFCSFDVIVEVSAAQNTLATKYTFQLCDGIPVIRCAEDCHDKAYDEFGHSKSVLEHALTHSHRISIYPTDAYYKRYHTESPYNIAMRTVGLILFTSIIIMSYDHFIVRESRRNLLVLDAKRRFVRFVSHEIRTPLNTTILGLKLLLNRITDYESDGVMPSKASSKTEQMELSNDILLSAECAVGVLNDLLNYDKVESGSLQLEMKPLMASKVFNSVIKTCRTIAEQSDVFVNVIEEFEMNRRAGIRLWSSHSQSQSSFSSSSTDMAFASSSSSSSTSSKGVNRSFSLEDIMIVADEIRFTYVLDTVISNALKFTTTGDTVTIRVVRLPSATPPQMEIEEGLSFAGYLSISVRDNGPGVSEENQMKFKMSELFNSTALHSGQGSGIALFLAKAISELHFGRILMQSDGEGCGSTFTVELPCFTRSGDTAVLVSSQSEGLSANEVEDQASGVKKGINIPPMHILVVDDAMLCRKMLRKSLQMLGHSCVEASDGEKCFQLIQQTPATTYGCILMDSEMPGISGPETCQKLRAFGYSGLIFGLTGNMMPEDIKHFKDFGANEVIGKPFETDEFYRALQKYVDL